jgi:hypothetical protein
VPSYSPKAAKSKIQKVCGRVEMILSGPGVGAVWK